jgi:hypothetical protein
MCIGTILIYATPCTVRLCFNLDNQTGLCKLTVSRSKFNDGHYIVKKTAHAAVVRSTYLGFVCYAGLAVSICYNADIIIRSPVSN